MYAFPRIGRRVGTERLVVIGSLAFALRALLASLIVDPVALVLIAPLEGIGFACVFVGGVTVVAAGRRPASGNGAGPVRRRQRAGHDRRLGARRGDRRRARDPRPLPALRAREPRRDRDRGCRLARPTESEPDPVDRRDRTRNRLEIRGVWRSTPPPHRGGSVHAPRSTDRRDAPRAWSGGVRHRHGVGQGRGRDADPRRRLSPSTPRPAARSRSPGRSESSTRNGATQPFSAEGLFVRLAPATGAPLEVAARQDRPGHYIASVTVPPGGLGAVVIGLQGTSSVWRTASARGADEIFMTAKAGSRGGVLPIDPVAKPPTAVPAGAPTGCGDAGPDADGRHRIRPSSSSRCWPVSSVLGAARHPPTERDRPGLIARHARPSRSAVSRAGLPPRPRGPGR